MDVRGTLSGDSCLIIAIKNGDQNLLLCMLNLIWNCNEASSDSSLIFINILRSKYNHIKDNTILDALLEFKLFSVLNYLIHQNQDCDMCFLLDREITQINEAMGVKKRHLLHNC